MYDILKTDPKPHLIPGKLQGSLHTEDYTWRSQSMYSTAVHVVTVPLTAQFVYKNNYFNNNGSQHIPLDSCCQSWLSKEKAG